MYYIIVRLAFKDFNFIILSIDSVSKKSASHFYRVTTRGFKESFYQTKLEIVTTVTLYKQIFKCAFNRYK